MEQQRAGKNIAFLHKEFFHGGTEKVTLNLSEEFSRRGFRCFAICTEYQEWDCLAGSQPPLCLLPFSGSGLRNSGQGTCEEDRAYMQFVIEQVDRLGIDFLFVVYPFFENLHLVREACPVKLVFVDHSVPFWQIDSRVGLRPVSWKKRLWKLVTAVPKEKIFRRYSRRWLPLYRYTYEVCDAYVVLADAYREQLCGRLGIDGKKIRTIANFCKPVGGAGEGEKENIVLYCGRMTYKDKRVDRLLRIWNRIWKEVPGWKLVLVGQGPEKGKLERFARSRKVGNVRFEGWQQDPAPFFRKASVICLVSTFESFGLVLVEAMSAGCVPVAFDCSAGVSSIIRPDCGLLVRPFREKEYACRLKALLKDAPLREALARKAVEKAGCFAPEPVMEQWMALLREL